MHTPVLMRDFASHTDWYVMFHIHLNLAEISFLNGSHISAVAH